jgi:hypothetical protein
VTRYTLTSLQNYRTYKLQVQPYDVMGQPGPVSDPLMLAPTPLGDADAPERPINLSAVYDSESRVINVAWAQGDDAVGYHVYYDTDVIGSYVGTGAREGDSPILQSRVGSLTLTGLQPGVQYYVTVSAFDAAGNESDPADPVAVLVSAYVDSDHDGLPDDWEMVNLGTLSFGAHDDPDGDLVDNLAEYSITHTHPARWDTDGDQVRDGNDAHPLSAADMDRDGMPDDWETYYGVTDPEADPDADGLINAREFAEKSSPWNPDTDGDELGDGFEADSLGTDPWNPDTDGGGEWDGSEYIFGRNPLDPRDDVPGAAAVEQPTDRPRLTALGTVRPNPFTESVVIPYSLSEKRHVRVTVFDVSGRVVRKVANLVQSAGYRQVTWDGRDDRGHRAPSGIYYVRFEADQYARDRKIVMMR